MSAGLSAGAFEGPYCHASVVVVGERGLLLLGASGAGKSSLADRMIAEARARGLFAGLVGDDRVALLVCAGRLVASAHPAVAGWIERRGTGIVAIDHLPRAVISAVVSIEANPPRFSEESERFMVIKGVKLPLLRLQADQDLAARAHLALGLIGV